MKSDFREITEILDGARSSVAKYDRDGDPANLVEGLLAVARAIRTAADIIAGTPSQDLTPIVEALGRALEVAARGLRDE